MAQNTLDTTRRDDVPPGSEHAPDAEVAGPLRLLVLRLHFYAGVLVGPFLLIAALSGLVYAISPSLEAVVDRGMLRASATDQRIALGDQIRTATARHADLPLAGVVPGENGATTRVTFTDSTLPSSSYQRVVFVDPSTGEIRGDTVQYGSSAALPLRTFISEVHRRLHLGDAGRVYSELAASWLAPLALGGLALWWDRSRRTRRAGTRARQPGRSGAGRPRLVRRHAVLGSWIAAGLLVLSATGLTWSTYAGGRVSDLRAALNWSTPALAANPTPAPQVSGDTAVGHEGHDAGHAAGGSTPVAPAGPPSVADQAAPALAAARVAGFAGAVQLTPPSQDASGAPWRVKETRRSWTAGPNAVSVDPTSGRVVQRLDFADWPIAAKLTDWGIRVHMGFLFGLLNQLLLAALAACLIVTIVRGYRMWWLRRPGGNGVGRPPVRGALRALARRKPVAVGLWAVVVAAFAWAIPLLGVSLAAFLLIDTALGAAARRRGAGARTPAG